MTLPSPPVTKTGTMTRLERTVSLTWGGADGCAELLRGLLRDAGGGERQQERQG